MIFTDYYRFERFNLMAKSRMDCVASTKSYPEFEEKRACKGIKQSSKRDATNIDGLSCYYGKVNDNFGGNIHRKADMAITTKGKNLSSVFVPDINFNIGFGDVRGTSDAIIFVFKALNVIDGRIVTGGIIEMFIARGKSKECRALYNLVCDGELDDEMNNLRGLARQEVGAMERNIFDSVNAGKAVTDSVTTNNT